MKIKHPSLKQQEEGSAPSAEISSPSAPKKMTVAEEWEEISREYGVPADKQYNTGIELNEKSIDTI